MRVIAFWGALAGLVVLAGRGAVLGITLAGVDEAELLSLAERVASVGQIVFTLLIVAFFFGYAVTGRGASGRGG